MSQFTINPRQVLLVENEPVIAMDLAAHLADHGLRVAGPFSRCGDALAWLVQGEPDCAVIDVFLQDGSGFEIARELRRRGTPYVFFSGATQSGPEALGEWGEATWVAKPVAASHLVRILADLPCQRAGIADGVRGTQTIS